MRQTKFIVFMIQEMSTKNVSFMTPGAQVHILGHGHISHYSQYVINIHRIDCYCVMGL